MGKQKEMINLNTAINLLRVAESNRFFLNKRYSNQEKTLEEWKSLFEKEKISFLK